MKHIEIRNAFKAWFSSKVRVDAWSVEPPKNVAVLGIDGKAYPANSALIGPMTNVAMAKPMNGLPGEKSYLFEGVFPLSVMYRFSSRLKEHQLPTTDAETLWGTINAMWIKNHIGETVLEQFAMDTESPIVIGKLPSYSDDWLLAINWLFGIRVEVEPSLSGLQPPDDSLNPDDRVFSVEFGLWRDFIDEEEPERLVYP